VAGQERAVGHPLPHQALTVARVQDPGQRALRQSGGQVQVVQAAGPHLLQRPLSIQAILAVEGGQRRARHVAG
jgi:hypothetical protein